MHWSVFGPPAAMAVRQTLSLVRATSVGRVVTLTTVKTASAASGHIATPSAASQNQVSHMTSEITKLKPPQNVLCRNGK